MDNNKAFYLTLDFEEDVGSATAANTYYSHKGSMEFIAFVKKNNLRVTLFVTGEILELYPDLLDPYLQEDGYFSYELHAYNHQDAYAGPKRRIENIQKGLDAYQSFFGRLPSFYRAPDGIIAKEDLTYLMAQGISTGSNFFPTFFPGRFNNWHIPTAPFTIQGQNYMEVPFSVTRYLKLPIALSYMQLFGLGFYKLLFSLAKPGHIIFDFHLHDLFPEYWYKTVKISRMHTLGHYRMSRGHYAFSAFEKIIAYFKSEGYTFYPLSTLVESFDKKRLKELPMEDIFR